MFTSLSAQRAEIALPPFCASPLRLRGPGAAATCCRHPAAISTITFETSSPPTLTPHTQVEPSERPAVMLQALTHFNNGIAAEKRALRALPFVKDVELPRSLAKVGVARAPALLAGRFPALGWLIWSLCWPLFAREASGVNLLMMRSPELFLQVVSVFSLVLPRLGACCCLIISFGCA